MKKTFLIWIGPLKLGYLCGPYIIIFLKKKINNNEAHRFREFFENVSFEIPNKLYFNDMEVISQSTRLRVLLVIGSWVTKRQWKSICVMCLRTNVKNLDLIITFFLLVIISLSIVTYRLQLATCKFDIGK